MFHLQRRKIMYDKFNDEECFVVIKRPCRNVNNNHCNFPPQLMFDEGREEYYQDNSDFQDFGWNDGRDERRHHNCRCCNHCNKPNRPNRKGCFNFIRFC